jgi:hypothetical protein
MMQLSEWKLFWRYGSEGCWYATSENRSSSVLLPLETGYDFCHIDIKESRDKCESWQEKKNDDRINRHGPREYDSV